MRWIAIIGLSVAVLASAARADKTAYLDLARQGWNYELRTTMIGRDLSIPVHINGRDLSGASICLVGEQPNAQSSEILKAFRALLHHSYGKVAPMRYAGHDARACGTGRIVILRLYSGHPPNRGLSRDLNWMNGVYELGLPAGRDYMVSSPAMAQTFFGRRGQATHIMVKQAAFATSGAMETAFYKSILIEELFQSFTFGMDILLFDREAQFLSKLQETPVSLYRFPWGSRAFMQGLLSSNPEGLCAFDLFMLHAVGQAPVDQTVEPQFIDYIDTHFSRLVALAKGTMADDRFAPLLDPSCAEQA